MTTIKDISQATGYSASTVSIVLRGLGKKRNIPESTQKTILDAAAKMNYTPNTSARRLRSDEPQHRTIAIFWATDFRVTMVASFLKGIQTYVESHDSDIEVAIRPYTVGRLSEAATLRTLSMYSGAIICTASREDMDYIEGLLLMTPIVIYNRRCNKYPVVSVDHEEIGSFAARRMLAQGCSCAAILTDAAESTYSHRRQVSFIKTLRGAQINPTVISIRECSAAAGYESTRAYLEALDYTQKIGIFLSADVLAFGAARAIRELPADKQAMVRLISIGTSEPALYPCIDPQPEIIQIPIDRLATLCAERLDTLMSGGTITEQTTIVPFEHFA